MTDLRRYAESSKEWTHGQKTEDELLQRIWNLAGDVTHLADQLDRAEAIIEGQKEWIDRVADFSTDAATDADAVRRAAEKAVFQLRTSDDEYARLVGKRLSESLGSLTIRERLQLNAEKVRSWPAYLRVTSSAKLASERRGTGRIVEKRERPPMVITDVCHICKRSLDEPGELWCSAGHPLPLCKCGEQQNAPLETVQQGEVIRHGWKCATCRWWNWR